MRIMTLVALTIGLMACVNLERHPESGYAYYEGGQKSTVKEYYKDKKSYKVGVAKEELGYRPTESLGENDRYRLNNRLQLKRLESEISTQNERKQYYHYKPMLRSDRERVQFLSIPTAEGRERYAQSKNLAEQFNQFDDPTLSLIEENDIAVGMNQQAVRESWGDPDRIDVAGSEIYQNQAWHYTKMVSSHDGYTKQKRIIFFDSGRVVGWETY